MKKLKNTIPALAISAFLIGCSDSKPDSHGHEHAGPDSDHGHSHAAPGEEDDNEPTEIALGMYDIGNMSVETYQGHGNVEAGKESHLVIKPLGTDVGELSVRAWIGTSDRTLSAVGKGEYDTSKARYDIHAIAPDPLPSDSDWWVEIENLDGTKQVESFPWR